MVSHHNQETAQAIKTLTEQIAQLSINLAQKQPIVKETNYAKSPRPPRTSATCYYCGKNGHFITQCQVKREDQRKERKNPSYNQNYNQGYNSNNNLRERASRSYNRPRNDQWEQRD